MTTKVALTISQIDYLDKSEENTFDVEATKEEKRIIYKEVETDAKVIIELGDNSIHIKRLYDTVTNIELVKGGEGEAIISSNYGEMIFKTRLIESKIDEDKIVVNYQLISESELITHKKITWKIRGK